MENYMYNFMCHLQSWVAQGRPVHRCTISFQELLHQGNITLIPGEVYPNTVHVISAVGEEDGQQEGATASLASVEPCCGTHLLNTAHIGSFVIESVVGMHHILPVYAC